MSRIYIVRHGETQWNREEVFRGSKDIPLNETGRQQAEMAGRYFSDRSLTGIISSPLKRARQTAEEISRSACVKIIAMDEFTDMNFGIWEGLTMQKVKNDFPSDFILWEESPEKLQIEEGETLGMVRERVSKGLKNINFLPEETVAIVTHRVICKIIVLYTLGIGNEHFWDMKFDTASITLLEYNKGRHTLIFSNKDVSRQRNHACPDF